jgi:pimeloyl-ACP methyl ester carboxylesterase
MNFVQWLCIPYEHRAGAANLRDRARRAHVGAVTTGKVAGRFVQADFATVERAGHWPHIERPDAVANLIL